MTTLKEYTKEAHTAAEQTTISKQLVKGTISEFHWAVVLKQKLFIAQTIDQVLDLPEEVAMSDVIMQDLMPYNDKWVLVALPSTIEYCDFMLANEPEMVAADLYVNYLGDLFGGRFIHDALPFETKTHLNLPNKTERVEKIRTIIKDKDDVLKDRALLAFEHITHIYEQIFQQVELSCGPAV